MSKTICQTLAAQWIVALRRYGRENDRVVTIKDTLEMPAQSPCGEAILLLVNRTEDYLQLARLDPSLVAQVRQTACTQIDILANG